MGDTSAVTNSRKRRVHKKSRGGCSNCKLRRVKCDEEKPRCQKCITYGVACDYTPSEDAGHRDLQLDGETSFQIQAEPQTVSVYPLTPPDENISALQGLKLDLHESQDVHVMENADVQVLQRFYDRTVWTIGTAGTVHIYRGHIVKLAAEHGFLAHVVLGMTLMHDRILENVLLPSKRESFHIYHGTAIFKRKISAPIKDQERDAMWAAAALLGCITFASIYETDANECWPLRPPSQSDMDWIYMGEGKKAAWDLTDPLREGSIWRAGINYEHNRDDGLPKDLKIEEMAALYPFIRKLSDLDISAADAAQDPYHTAASILTRLLPLQVTHSTIMYFLSFMGHMNPAFRELLRAKDPKALLLLCWWLAKLVDYPVWWLQTRAKLECQAICIYLERFHHNSADIIEVLEFPKVQCGLSRKS